MKMSKYKIRPIKNYDKPTGTGYYKVYVDYYWTCNKEGEPLAGEFSGQCNSNEEVAIYLLNQFKNNGNTQYDHVRQIPMVFIEHRC